MNWTDLLRDESQPLSIRQGHELVGSFMARLSDPVPPGLASSTMKSSTASRRLGYLIASSRLMAGVSQHPTWREFEQALSLRIASEPEEPSATEAAWPPFFTCDDVHDDRRGLDDLATYWHLTTGVSPRLLVQIVREGSC